MKKILWLLPLLSLLLMAASDPIRPIRLTIINKSEMDIAVQLQAKPRECCKGTQDLEGNFYYLPVAEGDRSTPTTKSFLIEPDTYQMLVFYIQTWDPVYGFDCNQNAPNKLIAENNIRVVILPCGEIPAPQAVGEPTMWKFLPYPVPAYGAFFNRYWITRLIY
jgi:hypothetical protein